MSATALIKFVQGAVTGPNGQMLVGALGAFTVENSDNTGVQSWQIDLYYVPPGSVIAESTPYASNDSSNTPSASIAADVTGSWRVGLKVWDVPDRDGPPIDTDIRIFAVPEPTNGTIIPPPQLSPPPINETNPTKPDEFNVGGQGNGWAGSGNGDGLLNDTLRKLDAGEFGGLPAGTSPEDGFIVAWSESEMSYVLTPRSGLTITSFAHTPVLFEWGQTVSAPSFSASYNVTPATAHLTNSANAEDVNASAHPTTLASAQNYTNTVVNGTVTFTLTAAIVGSPSVQALLVFAWGQNVYFGVAVPGTINATFVLALTAALQTSRSKTFTVTATTLQNIYYAWPTRLGTALFSVGGFGGGFTILTTTLAITNGQGKIENYTVAVSDLAGLGLTTVVAA